MATITLILGESGTGKTASLRNFSSGEIALINTAGKPLPFRSKFEMLNGTTELNQIGKFIRGTKAKIIVIDDCQYIMSFQYMRRLHENGWDKFNDIQGDFFNLIEYAKSLPDDITVYFLSHLETRDDGRQKIKTIGKMLDEKITIEGMFTTVLKTHVSDGKYFFLTQNSGLDTTKSPMGMFPSLAIDNDLKYVDDKIRSYYEIGEHKSDEEMAAEDSKVKTDLEPGRNGRIKRQSRADRTEKNDELDDALNKAEDTFKRVSRTARNDAVEEPTEDELDEAEEVIGSTTNGQQNATEQPRQRRTRKVRVEE